MSNTDIQLLRQSFESQLAAKAKDGLIYIEIFDENQALRGDLFKEYCNLEPEPDRETYTNFRLQREGIKSGTMSMAWIEKHKTLLMKIDKEFRAYQAAEAHYQRHEGEVQSIGERITPDLKRPQLIRSVSIGQLEEVEAWRKSLMKSLVEESRPSIKKETKTIIKDVTGTLKTIENHNSALAQHVAQKIYEDDIEWDLSVLIHSGSSDLKPSDPDFLLESAPNKQTRGISLPGYEFDNKLEEVRHNWRYVRTNLRNSIRDFISSKAKPDNANLPQKPKYAAVYYAAFHWILIDMGIANGFEINSSGKYPKSIIVAFAENKYHFDDGQGFYRAFIDLDITLREVFAQRLGPGYKDKLKEISNDNPKIITHLKGYPG